MTKTGIALIYLDSQGELRADPDLTAVGINGRQIEVAEPSWIDLPAGGALVQLPGRLALGFDQATWEAEVVEKGVAVAALLPVGYTRCLTPGYEKQDDTELPLFGYTAVGSYQGRLKVAALQTDQALKWNPLYYHTSDLPQRIEEFHRIFPHNRIIAQLGKCALEYRCLTAQNLFYRRWEAGIPVSPVCNADCLGCISKQPAECCPAPQSRIDFVPSVSELVEPVTHHLSQAVEAIVSFGQGCEGEPSLQTELLTEALVAIRNTTASGTININTNAGCYEAICQLVDHGLDSMRVSLFSAIAEDYDWFHRPKGYGLLDVKQAVRYAIGSGRCVSLNLLFFPGFTNQAVQTNALYDFIAETGLAQIQLRNLNLDPEKLTGRFQDDETPTVAHWLAGLKAKFPGIAIGNYSRPHR